MRRSPYGFEIFDNCQTCQWRTEQFFCAVGEDALAEFDRLGFANVYPPRSVIFCEGDAPRGVFLLCRGTVKLTVGSGDGKTLIARIAHPGEALGLSSVLAGHAYNVTSETLEPCQVKFIRREDFTRWIDAHHDACKHACRQLIGEFETSTDHVRSLGLSHSAAEKLAHLILQWTDEAGHDTPTGVRVQMLMTHQDISQLIGTSRETVTRLLKHFRDRHYLSIKGSTLVIHDKPALKALVHL